VQGGHAPGFAAAELREDCADLHVVDQARVEVGGCGEGCFQDVGEERMVVGVFEAAFLCSGDGRAEGGEEDDVVGVLLEDVFGAFLDEAGHFGLGLLVVVVVVVVAQTEGMCTVKSRGRCVYVFTSLDRERGEDKCRMRRE
jgi:hypothetical protein